MRLFIMMIGLLSSLSAYSFEIHGHRGARSLWPENTLAGFYYAIVDGADYLELDVHLSKDGEIVIHHDLEVKTELCQVPKEVNQKYWGDLSLRKMDYVDIKKIDCGYTDQDFPLQKPHPESYIARLEDVYDMLLEMDHPNAKKVKLNIEFKTKFWESDKYIQRMLEKAVNTTYSYQFFDRVMMQSFNSSLVKVLKEWVPDLRVHYLSVSRAKSLVEKVKAWNLDGVSLKGSAASSRLVRSYQKAGLKVLVWTVNKKKDWGKLLEYNVDGIITDNPKALKKYLKAGKPAYIALKDF